MLPIYCAEVIEGAEFRTPQRRPHALSRFTKVPPELDNALQQTGFELITDVDKTREVSRQYKAQRDKALEKRPAPEGWMNLGQLFDIYRGREETIKSAIDTVIQRKRDEGLSEEEIALNWGRQCNSDNGRTTLFISPQAIAELGFKRKDEKRFAPEGWMNLSQLYDIYIGGNTRIKPAITAVIERKRSEGLSEEEIALHWGTEYDTDRKPAFFASPQTIIEAKLKRKDEKRFAPKGWASLSQLFDIYLGREETIKSAINTVIQKKREEGLSEEEIALHWGGKYYTDRGSGFFVSPQAIAEAGLKKKDEKRFVPEGWMSQTQLCDIYIGGSERIKSAIATVIQRKRNEGLPEEEIALYWGGKYDSGPGFFVSPQTIVESGLKRLDDKRFAPEGWMNQNQLINIYIGDNKKIKPAIDTLIKRKRDEGLSEVEIALHWGKQCAADNGRTILFISPQAIAELGLERKDDKNEKRDDNISLKASRPKPQGSYTKGVRESQKHKPHEL
jgi:hypothetical protein